MRAARLAEWGYGHEAVCHAKGEYARDDDGDGFCEVHVNTLEGFWSLLRSWLRPHRGISQERLPLYLGFFEFVHNVRVPGMVHGRVVRPPVVGAKVVSVDESSVSGLPGVLKVIVKNDFVGIVADNTSVAPFRISSQLDDMVHQGVGSVRFQIDWSAIQPYKKWKQVPSQDKSLYTDEGGVPTKYPNPDRVIGALAERHMTALPVVLNAPKWDTAKPSYKGQIFAHVPKKFGAYTRFLKALVHRYGHGGTFWDEHPEIEPRPLKQIQPWNEPNIRPFWNIKPWDRKFVSLARASYKAIKQADPSVKVVFAGLSRLDAEPNVHPHILTSSHPHILTFLKSSQRLRGNPRRAP